MKNLESEQVPDSWTENEHLSSSSLFPGAFLTWKIDLKKFIDQDVSEYLICLQVYPDLVHSISQWKEIGNNSYLKCFSQNPLSADNLIKTKIPFLFGNIKCYTMGLKTKTL